MGPLEGLLVIDFSQFLAGPSASLRLADLGARVIKIERPPSEASCAANSTSRIWNWTATARFSTQLIEIRKASPAHLKNVDDRAVVYKIVSRADVVIQNFRPGVMEKLGFHY